MGLILIEVNNRLVKLAKDPKSAPVCYAGGPSEPENEQHWPVWWKVHARARTDNTKSESWKFVKVSDGTTVKNQADQLTTRLQVELSGDVNSEQAGTYKIEAILRNPADKPTTPYEYYIKLDIPQVDVKATG
ncbi:hypothetical protein COT48_02405, partial [Candidatus Woesearchaeota archaeon CG08_land_8_20_14_0_20_47_9]